MEREQQQLKLGKGQSLFVKSQLRQLRQEDDTWEADFLPLTCKPRKWLGMVISPPHGYFLAEYTVEEPPTVNDLARLLAEAMRRPLAEFAHRPRFLHLRERPEWAELLLHLKQIGIKVQFQDTLPQWDEAFQELSAILEKPRTGSGKRVAPKKG